MKQYIFDQFLKAYKSKGENKAVLIFWSVLRKYFLGRGTFINYTIGKFTLKMEATHILPMVMLDHPLYSQNIIQLAKVVKAKYPALSVIDIGANIGDTAAFILSHVQTLVLCIDGSEEYINVLEQNASKMPDVQVCFTLLGAEDTALQAQVKNHDGTAMLVASQQEVQIQKLSTVLKKFPRFAAAKLIKVDTDGFDTLILKGSEDVLLANKPVLFFEYDPDFLKLHGEDDLSIFPFLTQCGYTKLVIWDNLGNYIGKLALSDQKGIAEMHKRYSGKHNLAFIDIAAFAREDEDLTEKFG
ncbi:MAG: FkbM family methyltransferase [Bacteroidia bacterium]|nr:FkbM family methyltransferase [Bacteroidia bacterium]